MKIRRKLCPTRNYGRQRHRVLRRIISALCINPILPAAIGSEGEPDRNHRVVLCHLQLKPLTALRGIEPVATDVAVDGDRPAGNLDRTYAVGVYIRKPDVAV